MASCWYVRRSLACKRVRELFRRKHGATGRLWCLNLCSPIQRWRNGKGLLGGHWLQRGSNCCWWVVSGCQTGALTLVCRTIIYTYPKGDHFISGFGSLGSKEMWRSKHDCKWRKQTELHGRRTLEAISIFLDIAKWVFTSGYADRNFAEFWNNRCF